VKLMLVRLKFTFKSRGLATTSKDLSQDLHTESARSQILSAISQSGRGHTALGGRPPASRIPNLTRQYT
jgi:hypothetical protein